MYIFYIYNHNAKLLINYFNKYHFLMELFFTTIYESEPYIRHVREHALHHL